MPYMTHLGDVGHGQVRLDNVTSCVGAFTADVPVDSLVVVRVSTENLSSDTGETTRHSGITDQAANTWTKAIEWSVALDVPNDEEGQTVSIWWSKTTAPIANGDTITALFAASTHAAGFGADLYDIVDAGMEVEVVAANGAASPFGVDPLSVTVTIAEPEEITWVAAGAHAESGSITRVLDATFTVDRAVTSVNGGVNSKNTTYWGQYRQLLSDTETYDVSTTRNFAIVLVAFRLVEPPPPPPEPGNREYRRDFESVGHHVDGTTTERRVDAIVPTYLVAHSVGPTLLESASGAESALWRARADGNAVYLCQASGGTWGPETLLTTATGSAPIAELDLAFNEAGKPVLVAERPTGSGGAAEVWIYFYNDHYLIDAYVWQGLGAGTSPRCCSDYFPPTVSGPDICPPEIDVQVVYMKPNVGMRRREESDRFVADNPTPLAWSPMRRLHRFVRTVDRRLSVWYSQRNLRTGRYIVGRVDSVPCPDARLLRPNLVEWSSPANDVMRALGPGAWSGPTSTDDFYLRVVTRDDVDAIEVAACSGLSGDFDQQVQESSGGFLTGAFHDFAFTITHGGGTCSLRAFRARTRRTIGETVCHSPWRYTVIPASGTAAADVNDIDVNCHRDLLLDVAGRLDDFLEHGYLEAIRETDVSAHGDNYPATCGEYPPITTAASGQWFVGGVRNTGPSFPTVTHVASFVSRRRAWCTFAFADEAAAVSGVCVGDVIDSVGSSIAPTKAFDWPSTRFPLQFPNDDGTMPVMPDTLDIIGSV